MFRQKILLNLCSVIYGINYSVRKIQVQRMIFLAQEETQY